MREEISKHAKLSTREDSRGVLRGVRGRVVVVLEKCLPLVLGRHPLCDSRLPQFCEILIIPQPGAQEGSDEGEFLKTLWKKEPGKGRCSRLFFAKFSARAKKIFYLRARRLREHSWRGDSRRETPRPRESSGESKRERKTLRKEQGGRKKTKKKRKETERKERRQTKKTKKTKKKEGRRKRKRKKGEERKEREKRKKEKKERRTRRRTRRRQEDKVTYTNTKSEVREPWNSLWVAWVLLG